MPHSLSHSFRGVARVHFDQDLFHCCRSRHDHRRSRVGQPVRAGGRHYRRRRHFHLPDPVQVVGRLQQRDREQDQLSGSYGDELNHLTGEIRRIGDLTPAQLDAAIDAVIERDSNAAMKIVRNDGAIDALEHEVSQDVARLLALRRPMARDLREILAALRISADIERIGDHATNIAENVYLLVHGTQITQTHSKRDVTSSLTTGDQR